MVADTNNYTHQQFRFCDMNKLNIQHRMLMVKHAATIAIQQQTYCRFFNIWDPLKRNLKTSSQFSGRASAYTLVDDIEHAEVNTDDQTIFNVHEVQFLKCIQTQLE